MQWKHQCVTPPLTKEKADELGEHGWELILFDGQNYWFKKEFS